MKQWDNLPYLDALRPDPGWLVERAILTTYSADLVTVVAALLALAGLDDDRGSGSKVDFANAYEQLRNKVLILLQAGQLGLPRKKIPILAVLDRFFKEINPSAGVWHPKIALIKFKPDPNMSRVSAPVSTWRLWLGSRNLTRSLDWDAGLLLISNRHGQQIPGIAELGAELAQRAAWADFTPEQVYRDLARVPWQSPKGVTVEEVQLFTGNSTRGLPPSPDGLTQLVVVSPFLDGKTVKSLGKWGDRQQAKRMLLSTKLELTRLHSQTGRPLAGYTELLTRDAPEADDVQLWHVEPADQAGKDTATDEQIAERGLHAKLIYAEHQRGRTLWLGSANATTPGWTGPNIEVVSRINITKSDIGEGLLEFVNAAQIVDPLELPAPAEVDSEENALEEARQQVITRWSGVTQKYQTIGHPMLISSSSPHPDNEAVILEVGLFGCDLASWPRGDRQLSLPSITPAQVTELVQIRLTLGQHRCAWLQRAPIYPPPGEERDQRAMARYLDAHAFFLWLRSLLKVDDIGNGGGDWDDPPPTRATRPPVGNELPWWAVTLEELLKAWSRDPASLQAIDGKVEHYLALLGESPLPSGEDTQVLAEFQQTWQLLHQVLVQESR